MKRNIYVSVLITFWSNSRISLRECVQTAYEQQQKKMNVILLKSNDSSTSDRYVEFLISQQSNLLKHVEQINLLKFSYQNLDLLKSKLFTLLLENTNYADAFFKCLILTSRQTVESIQHALNVTVGDNLPSVNISTRLENSQDKFLVYCVGESTAGRFKKLVQSLKKNNPLLDERLVLRLVDDSTKTEHKQNARELFKLIKQDYELIKLSLGPTRENFKYALYPCSKIRKDDLSKSLNENEISYEEIHAYDTVPSEIGIEKLRNCLQILASISVLVFFSPSGCDALFNDKNLNKLINSKLNTFKFVSIGPSTTQKLKIYVDQSLIYELTKPSPEALWDCILTISK